MNAHTKVASCVTTDQEAELPGVMQVEAVDGAQLG